MPITPEGLERFGAQDALNKTFRWLAAQGEIVEMERLWLLGPDIDGAEEVDLDTPLSSAIQNGEYGAAVWLLNRDASPYKIESVTGYTPLHDLVQHLATGQANDAAFEKSGLWEKFAAHGPLLEYRTNDGETALSIAIREQDHGIAERLLKLGASVETRCLDRSPLLYALHMRSIPCFHLLLKNGADIFPPDLPDPCTYLHDAMNSAALNKNRALELQLDEARSCLDVLSTHFERVEMYALQLQNAMGFGGVGSKVNMPEAEKALFNGTEPKFLLLQFAGSKKLRELFTPELWEGKDLAALQTLYRRCAETLPAHYQPRLEAIDLTWAKNAQSFETRLAVSRAPQCLPGKTR